MILVENVPGIERRGGIVKVVRGSEFKNDIFDTFKNRYKCHNVPPPSTTIKEKREKSFK
jgi:hypothetical protein